MATTPIQIPKGTDLTVNITIYQSDGVTPIDLNVFSYGDLYLYQLGNKNVIEKYSIVAATGYDSLIITDASNGVVQFILGHSVTRKCSVSELYAFIRVSDGTYYYGQTKVLIGNITDSIGGGYDVPI